MRLGKVYHNLNISDYEYNYKRLTFIFSSKFYIKKFESELANYVLLEKNKIATRYQVDLEASEYLALSLYKKIEKRGFKVYFDGKEISKNDYFIVSFGR